MVEVYRPRRSRDGGSCIYLDVVVLVEFGYT